MMDMASTTLLMRLASGRVTELYRSSLVGRLCGVMCCSVFAQVDADPVQRPCGLPLNLVDLDIISWSLSNNHCSSDKSAPIVSPARVY